MNGDDRQFGFIDALAILSFMLGYENLLENRQQSACNDVSAANDRQAGYMLAEIQRLFEEQNRLLKRIDKKLDSLPGVK